MRPGHNPYSRLSNWTDFMSTNHVSLIFSSRLFTDAVNNWNALRPVVEEWILISSTGGMTYLDIGDVSLIQQQNAIQLMRYSDDVTHSVRSIEYCTR